jgi:hypothetical protein
LFLASEIASVLGLRNIRDSLTSFPAQMKRHLPVMTNGGMQIFVFLTEAGLYRLLFRSRKPVAARFQEWAAQTLQGFRVEMLQAQRSSNALECNDLALEKHYQSILEAEIGASHLKNDHGETDISTARAHIEIKTWKRYKEALGQLIFYDAAAKRQELWVCFFGKAPEAHHLSDIVGIFKKHGVHVVSFREDGDAVLVNHDDGREQEIAEFCKMFW